MKTELPNLLHKLCRYKTVSLKYGKYDGFMTKKALHYFLGNAGLCN